MMPKITQGIEASGVMFGGPQGSLVQFVSVLVPKPSKLQKQLEEVFGGQQDSKAACKLSTEFGSLCIHARDVIEDSIEAG